MTSAERNSDFKLTPDIPYLALAVELWFVFCENLGENWPRYTGTALYQTIVAVAVFPQQFVLQNVVYFVVFYKWEIWNIQIFAQYHSIILTNGYSLRLVYSTVLHAINVRSHDFTNKSYCYIILLFRQKISYN